jgi:chromosome segregation ATPase
MIMKIAQISEGTEQLIEKIEKTKNANQTLADQIENVRKKREKMNKDYRMLLELQYQRESPEQKPTSLSEKEHEKEEKQSEKKEQYYDPGNPLLDTIITSANTSFGKWTKEKPEQPVMGMV